MAKMLKQLVFGQKKNPPAPPRPDYEGDKLSEVPFENQASVQFFVDHDYENLPKFKGQVQFADKKESQLLVFENYSEPADLRAELTVLEADPLYVSPLDDQRTAPPQTPWTAAKEEEDMYCVPYDTPESEAAPTVPQVDIVGGYVSHKLGRKAVLMYFSASYTISWLAIAYAPSIAFVYAGRLVSGFCSGICSVAVPAYIVEISTVHIRGLLTAGFQVAFTLGVFLIMAFGIALRWSWLAVSGAFIVALGACLMYFMPESPPWLVRAFKNADAVKGLMFLRGSRRQAMNEMKELVEHIADEQKNGITLNEFQDPALYKPTLIAVALMFFQQFSGINPLMSYSVENFQKAKSSTDPSVSAAIVALVQVAATIASSLLMDRAGRRILYMTSGIFMTLSLLALGVYSYYSLELGAEMPSHWTWIPLVSFVFYIAAFSLGFGTVPMVVVPEMIPIRSRSFLIAVANTSGSFFGFIVTKTFEDMRSVLGMAGLYWLYAAFTVLGFLFYCILIPETKGRSIRDIHRSFSVPKSS